MIYLEDMTTNQHYRIVKVRGKWGRWGKLYIGVIHILKVVITSQKFKFRYIPLQNLPHLPHLPHQRFIEL